MKAIKFLLVAALLCDTARSYASTNVYLTEVPDYDWYCGCMGTASGNLMGYWDRHGFPDFYTGKVNGGLAPLNTSGTNYGIISLWASKAGLDGRPANKPGHQDDYYVQIDNLAPDPFVLAARPEHQPDCIGDFIGLSQLKWKNMAGECNGNVDGYCFVYWDTNGDRRVNFTPTPDQNPPVREVQSGLRAWTQYRNYDCSIFTQLTEFNPQHPAGKGFTYEDLKAEIDAGYPVLLFLQNFAQKSRNIGTVTNVNPLIHSMLAYGYFISDTGTRYVRYKTSWASGPNMLSIWAGQPWQAGLPVRGVIGYHPLPQIRNCKASQAGLTVQWDGPTSWLFRSDGITTTTNRVQGYVVELSPSLSDGTFEAVSPVLPTNSYTISNYSTRSFIRVKMVSP